MMLTVDCSTTQKWIAEALDTAKYDTSGCYHVQALLDYCIDSVRRKFDPTYFIVTRAA